MKKIMKVYDSFSIAIRISVFGFLMVAVGFLIQNESVNIFYTFKSSFMLFLSEGFLKLGTTIIANLPMIFMLNGVCKKANSGYPVCLALVSYFTYLTVTTLFSTNNLASTAYCTGLGINSIFNINNGTKYPLETGLIGSFICAYVTRIAYIRSRHRNTYSVLGFLNRDSAGVIYVICFSALCGIVVSYAWPFVFNYIQTLITYISKDLMDPIRMAMYGILDRGLSILSLNNIIRQPFWYTTLGGSLQTISGQTIAGDINIWSYVKSSSSSYIGAGRFVTAYYVINMFMVPAIYLGMLSSITDKEEKGKFILPCIGGIILSIVCGNPLPLELTMLFTSPLLLITYLLGVGGVFFYLNLRGIYLGSNVIPGSVVTAMPGNFPDFIINLRNIYYVDQLGKILIVGAVAGLIMFLLSLSYYRFFAYDFARTGKGKKFAKTIIDMCGGKENIVSVESGLFKVCIHLNNLESVDLNLIQSSNIDKIAETKDGIDITCGSSAYIVVSRIKNLIK